MGHTVISGRAGNICTPFNCPHYIYFPLLAKHLIRKLNVFMRSLPKRTTKCLTDYNYFLYFKELVGTEEGARHTQFTSLHQWENLLSNSFYVSPAQRQEKPLHESSLPPPVVQHPILVSSKWHQRKKCPSCHQEEEAWSPAPLLDLPVDHAFLHFYPLSLYCLFICSCISPFS